MYIYIYIYTHIHTYLLLSINANDQLHIGRQAAGKPARATHEPGEPGHNGSQHGDSYT